MSSRYGGLRRFASLATSIGRQGACARKEARERQSREIRRIRRKLGLSQVEAARLTGGGHNAFSRYERGEAMPMPAIINLFRILDKHPEMLRFLAKSRAS